MRCFACHKKVDDDEIFCPECGQQLRNYTRPSITSTREKSKNTGVGDSVQNNHFISGKLENKKAVEFESSPFPINDALKRIKIKISIFGGISLVSGLVTIVGFASNRSSLAAFLSIVFIATAIYCADIWLKCAELKDQRDNEKIGA